MDTEVLEYKDYEEREKWWRSTIRNTPVPGTYEVHDFLHDLNSVPISVTYGFKSSGRKRTADPSRTGAYLMPGLYRHKSFVQESKERQVTYSFKGTDREKTTGGMYGTLNKDTVESKLGPATYDRGYAPVARQSISHSAFKSQSQRFPTIYFKPKKGPGPGYYQAYKTSEVNKCNAATAPFKSRTPRFLKPHQQKTPGPGAYTKLLQTPMPAHIKNVGRYHGLFFPPGAT